MKYEDFDDEVWIKYFRANVLTTNRLSKFYLTKMINNGYIPIIFIASEEAIVPPGQIH